MTEKAPATVTIGIPTYNRADGFLREALESALGQTYEFVEIIVSDNCSTDNTAQYIAGFDDERLRYLRHGKNLGPNGNFNACLNAATGDYFLLLCDDDLIDADMVETCLQAANGRRDLGVIRCGARVIDEEGAVGYQRENIVDEDSLEGLARAWFAKSTAIYLCSTLFNTQALRDVGGLSSMHNLLEDGYGIARLGNSMGICNAKEVKASFRRYSQQRTNSVPIREWCEDYLGLLELICANVPDSERSEIRTVGHKYFGGLCLTRTHPLDSVIGRMRARKVVYDIFGYRFMMSRARKHVMRPVRRMLSQPKSA
ncbi:MAG: glycosyltransferase family 2 protein [Woeseiaceae bacterium]|nr:glycosyltransferase family 2 protein [Woeseiaceae bacterium]